MRIIDCDLLIQFALKPRCERCGKRNHNGLHPHHIMARGMGGGSRLDIPWNLVALCPTCHGLFHDGHIPRTEIWEIVAKREGVTADAILAEIYRLLRTSRKG